MYSYKNKRGNSYPTAHTQRLRLMGVLSVLMLSPLLLELLLLFHYYSQSAAAAGRGAEPVEHKVLEDYEEGLVLLVRAV